MFSLSFFAPQFGLVGTPEVCAGSAGTFHSPYGGFTMCVCARCKDIRASDLDALVSWMSP